MPPGQESDPADPAALRGDPDLAAVARDMVTGDADAEVVRRALAEGADDDIRKDASNAEIQQRLGRHVQKIRAAGLSR